MITLPNEGGREPVASRNRQKWGSVLIIVVLVLGVLLGWHYALSPELPLSSRNGAFDSIAKLIIVLMMTMHSNETLRTGSPQGFWHGSAGMLSVVLVTYSRVRALEGRLVLVLALVVTALWLGSAFACASRRQRTALWCIGLCSGLATSVLVSTWSDFRSTVYGLSP